MTGAPFVPLFAVEGGVGRNQQPAYGYKKLPTNTLIDSTISQAAFQTQLQTEADRVGQPPWINTNNFTTRRIVVPNDQPLEPMLLWRSSWGGGFTGTNYPSWALSMDKVCRAGFPIPSDYVPDSGSDKELVLIQPTYQYPSWASLNPPLVGRYFEGWIVEANPAYDPEQPKVWPNYVWRCSWPARVCGMNIWPGHFVDWNINSAQSWWPFQGFDGTNPANPNGTWQSFGEGASASGLALADSEILKSDLDRNILDGAWGLGHCIGLSVPSVGGFRWPAQRSDANQPSSFVIKYGMRLCLPANYVMPGGLHPVCEALIENCILSDDPAKPGYGLVVHEQTFSSIAFKAQPGAQVHWTGVAPNVVLANFPWDELQVIGLGGADASPVPLSAAPAAPPVNTSLPTISGPAVQGQSLGLLPGTWTGDPTITYGYKWQRSSDGSTWSDIASATGLIYQLQAADVGKTVRVLETATNGTGTANAASTASQTIVAGSANSFLLDTFTGTDGVNVESRAGEIGATWTKHGSSTGGTSNKIQANRSMGPVGSGTNIYYASVVPPTPHYDVTVLMKELSDNASSHISAAGRIDPAANTMYFAQYSSSSDLCTVAKVVAGAVTVLDSTAFLPSSSLTLRMIGDQISMLADGVIIGPITDAAITAAGRAGYRQGGFTSTTAGVHAANIEAVENIVVVVPNTEHWARGFLWTDTTETALANTANLTGAKWRNGFLRDPSGRLVTTTSGTTYKWGFLRDTNGALVVTNGHSTPRLRPFGTPV